MTPEPPLRSAISTTATPLSDRDNACQDLKPTRQEAARALDYATGALRAQLEARIQRTAAPICGAHAQDLGGTAQGNWRRSGSPTWPEDPHLALVHDMLQPDRIAVSMGTSFAPYPPGVAEPAAASSGRANRDPSAVVPDGATWCWDVWGSRMVVKMPTAGTLRAEVQTGSCGVGPWTLGAAALDFAR